MELKKKFRVWDPHDDEMWTPEYLSDDHYLIDMSGNIHVGGGFPVKADPAVKLMQWTGLKDANGTDIYEGDILSLTLDGKPTCFIEYESGAFHFKWIDPIFRIVRNRISEPIFRNIHLFPIIGNIYENPDLLKAYEKA